MGSITEVEIPSDEGRRSRAPTRVKSDSLIFTRIPVYVPKYPNPLAESITAADSPFSSALSVRVALIVKSESLTFTIVPGRVHRLQQSVPKYAKPPTGAMTAEAS